MSQVNLRKLGVFADNLPAKRTISVQASDFLIGGILCGTERKFDKAFEIKSYEKFQEIFGGQVTTTEYGVDAVRGFFDNVAGVDATLYVQSYVGYDIATDVIDAVTASRQKADVGAVGTALTIKDAYEDELGYGISGNRTGTKVTMVNRFATEAAGGVAATGVSTASLDSVSGIKVGDLILFNTVGGTKPVYKIVTAVDETAKTVTWSGNFEVSGGSGETLVTNDEVVIPGFRIQTYRKSTTGIVTEVDVELGKKICSTQSAVTDFFVDNIFKSSKWIKVTYVSASTLGDRLFADDTVPVYPTSGADGTAITTAEAITAMLVNFDNQPIRFICNPETTSQTLQAALITYSEGRSNDNPIVIVNIAEDRIKSQLVTIGNNYQVSSFIPAVVVAQWLQVANPFSNSALASPRTVPNVGHVMGAWIRTIGTLGIHYIPAVNSITIKGCVGVVGDQILDNDDRTDLAEAGINVIQNIAGEGIRMRNLFTLSTDSTYFFANGIAMRNFIKVSAEDSLKTMENQPNSFNNITTNKAALEEFLYNLWFRGSTGTVPAGETFGQTFRDDGSATQPKDHFQVIADATNNPQSDINLGQQDYYIYFTYPTPAGSIRIGVGILVLS